MEDRKLRVSKISVIPFIISIALVVLGAIMIFVLDEYGIPGLLSRLSLGIMALAVMFVCLIIGAAWGEGIIAKVKEKSFDFNGFFKGLLILFRSICVLVGLVLVLAVVCEKVKNTAAGSLVIIAVLILIIYIFVKYIKYCHKHKSKQFDIVLAIVLFAVIGVSSIIGVSSVYTSVSDMVTRNTYSIDVHSISVSKERLRKGGIVYELNAYDTDNKQIHFEVNKSTYKYYEESASRREKSKIICYEKSGVIQSIKYDN